MKVLQINVTCGYGSTGVITTEIAEQLEKKGHKAYIAYGHGNTTFNNSYKIGSKLSNKIHALLFSRILGIQGLGSIIPTIKLTRWIDSIKPDLIQLHTLHSNYINYPILFKYLSKSNIPVVWSFFDCWPFTGKCPHFTNVGCRKWEIGCNKCQHLDLGTKTYFFDQTKELYNLKKKYCSTLEKLDIIVCSKWLKSEVEKSMYKEHSIHMIYNWIDMDKFEEIYDDSIFQKYGIDKTKKILISVSAGWNDSTTRLEDAIRLSDILPENYQLVIVGKKTSKMRLPDNMAHIDYVNGTQELSKLYSCAVAFVGFSVEDTFGKVFAEAMLCGTPAVVFNATACPEVVGDTGFAVEPHNVEQMLSKILYIDHQGRDVFSEKCKERVRANYLYETNVGKYIEIYENLVSK